MNHYFVTGAQGCIGAWVVKTLLDRGDRPTVFDRSGDARRLRAILDDAALARVRFVTGDIADSAAVERALANSGAKRVIHLAGLQVPFCKADPPLGAAVNVVGTVSVFAAAAKLGVERVAYASSAAVYGLFDDGRRPTESDACEPATHYGVFKRANEGNARVFWLDDRLSSIGLRPLTVYGVGRDQGLTSDPTRAMKAAVVGRPFTIRFSGETDFQHVGDTARSFVAAADRGPEGAHVFNLEGDCVAIPRIVEIIDEVLPGAAAHITVTGGPIPVPPALDGQAFAAAVPDVPRIPIEDGIRATIARFRELATAGRLDLDDLEN